MFHAHLVHISFPPRVFLFDKFLVLPSPGQRIFTPNCQMSQGSFELFWRVEVSPWLHQPPRHSQPPSPQREAEGSPGWLVAAFTLPVFLQLAEGPRCLQQRLGSSGAPVSKRE